MKRYLLLVVCCLGLIFPGALRSQDTIIWGRSSVDSTYWFDHDAEDVAWYPIWTYCMGYLHQYVVPMSERGVAGKYIYGLALPFLSCDTVFLGDYGVVSPIDACLAPSQDSILWAMIKTRDTAGNLVTLDSCRGYCFKSRVLRVPSNYPDPRAGLYLVYEYYFKEPISLGRLDTFWIGYNHERPTTGIDEWIRYPILSSVIKYNRDALLPAMIRIAMYPLVGVWMPYSDSLLCDSNIIEDRGGEYVYRQMMSFPIMSPPTDTDQVACSAPEHLRLLEVGADYAVLQWDTVAGTMGYQLAVVEAGGDPDTVQTITRPTTIGSVSGLRPGVSYEAYVRSRGLHRCWLHDTILWSAWSEPCVIQMADTGSHDTTGIVGVEATGLQLRLKPNPAHSIMTVETNREDSYELTIQGDDGRRRMQQKFRGTRTEVNLSTLPAGYYVLTLRSASGIAVKGFVKE